MPMSSARMKSLDRGAAEQEQREQRQHHGQAGLIDRPKVCRMQWLTMSSNGSPACRTRFSRTRSNTTIVSWTLNPMTVSIAVTNRASIWTLEERAQDGEDADDHDHVVEQRDERGDPNWTSRNR